MTVPHWSASAVCRTIRKMCIRDRVICVVFQPELEEEELAAEIADMYLHGRAYYLSLIHILWDTFTQLIREVFCIINYIIAS